ncbi:MAG: AAA family ATPase [Myxococcales bacterium]
MQQSVNVVMIGGRAEAGVLEKDLAGLANVLAIEPDPARGKQVVQEAVPDVALLFLDHHPAAILELTRTLASSRCHTVVLSTNRDPENILRAMRAGARDFAFLEPKHPDVARSLRELPRRSTRPSSHRMRGQVIAVFGCKGGSGATTIALNLAGALIGAKGPNPAKVAVVDLDTEMGDVLTFLDLSSKYVFEDVVNNMARLDSDLLRQAMAQHRTGLSVLSQTDKLSEAAELHPEDCGRILAFLREHFDFVVIDGVRDFRELSLTALDQADVVLCTMTQDIPALKNVSHCFSIFKKLQYPTEKIRLVINRYRNSGKLTEAAIADALGRRVDAMVSNDYPGVIKAINEGQLLVEADPGGKVYEDIQSLVPLVYVAAVPAKKRGLFARWSKR